MAHPAPVVSDCQVYEPCQKRFVEVWLRTEAAACLAFPFRALLQPEELREMQGIIVRALMRALDAVQSADDMAAFWQLRREPELNMCMPQLDTLQHQVQVWYDDTLRCAKRGGLMHRVIAEHTAALPEGVADLVSSLLVDPASPSSRPTKHAQHHPCEPV